MFTGGAQRVGDEEGGADLQREHEPRNVATEGEVSGDEAADIERREEHHEPDYDVAPALARGPCARPERANRGEAKHGYTDEERRPRAHKEAVIEEAGCAIELGGVAVRGETEE